MNRPDPKSFVAVKHSFHFCSKANAAVVVCPAIFPTIYEFDCGWPANHLILPHNFPSSATHPLSRFKEAFFATVCRIGVDCFPAITPPFTKPFSNECLSDTSLRQIRQIIPPMEFLDVCVDSEGFVQFVAVFEPTKKLDDTVSEDTMLVTEIECPAMVAGA